MTDQSKAYLLAGCVILFWGTAAAAFKITLRYCNTVELLFFSSFTAAFVLFVILFSKKKLVILRSYQAKDFLQASILGFMNPFIYYLILFKAYSLLPGQIAQSLNFVWPIMIVLLSIPLLKQKIQLKNLLAILLSFCGVILISTRGNLLNMKIENPLGVALALTSSLIWALFFVINTRIEQDSECRLFLSFSIGSIFAAFIYFPQFTQPHVLGILGAIYIGIFEMAVSFVLWIKALKLSRSTAQVSNMVYLTPFVALIFLRIFISERILVSTVIGIILIISGIIYQRRLSK